MLHARRWLRRARALRAAACLASIALCACGDAPPPEAREAQVLLAETIPADSVNEPVRNLVMICIDTVRWDVFRALDDLGEDSFRPWSDRAMRFDRTQSTAPWTVPAVASALTGLYPQRHGAGFFPGAVANLSTTVPSALPEPLPSLPELLSERAFRTRGIVAHAWFPSRFGLAQGLDAVGYTRKDVNVLRKAFFWLASQEAMGDQRFFLYLHFMRPHRHPDWDDAEVEKLVGRLTPAEREAILDLDAMPFCRKPESAACRRFLAYAHSVVRLRRQLASLMARFEEQGLLEDTLFVLFADHGEEFYDHAPEQRSLAVDPRELYGFGHGQSLYQELVQVPLLVWHPRFAGGRSDEPASLVDIAPSVMTWLGFDASEFDFDGEVLSLTPGSAAPRALFSTGISFGPQQLAVVRDGWKRVLHVESGERQLFELPADPFERAPVDAPEVARQLDPLLEAHAARARDVEPGDAPVLSPESLRELQSLGYLEGATSP